MLKADLMLGLNNSFNAQNMKKLGLKDKFFKSLLEIFSKKSSIFSIRFFAYLFPRDYTNDELWPTMSHVID